MKMIALVAVMSFLVLSGLAFASQSGEQKDRPSMGEMMKGRKEGDRMGGMMGMMKMMEQCASMRMESTYQESEQTKESQKK